MVITEKFITIIIASYAAIISTIVAIWNILNDLRDKPKLKVGANLGFYQMTDGSAGNSTISFNAVNIRKRPVTISSFGVRLKKTDKNWQIWKNIKLPKRLQEGEEYSYHMSLEKFQKQIEGYEAKYVWFNDNYGKTYKSKKIQKILK